MNSRTFLKWVSAWAAIVLAQGALLSASAEEVIYESSNPPPGVQSETHYNQVPGYSDDGINFNIGRTFENEVLFKVDYDGRADRAYNVYFWVQGHEPGTENIRGNDIDPCTCDGLDGSVLNEFQHYTRIYRIPAGTRWARLAAKDCAWVKDVTVSIVSVSEAMKVYDSIWEEVNTGLNDDDLLKAVLTNHPIPADPFANLPKFKQALQDGTPCHVHFLGDSIMADTCTSSFKTLIHSAYPNANLEFSLKWGPNMGCIDFCNEFDVWVPAETQVLVIGGISNFRADTTGSLEDKKSALTSVIKTALGKGMEVLYLSTQKSFDSRGTEDSDRFAGTPRDNLWYTERSSVEWTSSDDNLYNFAYFPEAQEAALESAVVDGKKAQYWDVFPQYQAFVYKSGRPYGWFNRDPTHNNARGRELLSRVLFEYVKAGVPVPSGDSNEDYAASTNLVGVTWLKNPTNPANVTNLLVAVPWVATDGRDISLTNVIRTANLSEGDMIWICNAPDPTHKSLQYEAWRLNSSTNWEAISVVSPGTGKSTSRDPATVTLKVGDAYRVVRKGTGNVYVCGRAPEAGAKVTHTFSGAGWHLFAPPQSGEKFQFTTADINSWNWSDNLVAGDQVLYQMASGNLNTLKYSNDSFSCKPSYKNMKSLVGSGMWFFNSTDKIVTVSFP